MDSIHLRMDVDAMFSFSSFSVVPLLMSIRQGRPVCCADAHGQEIDTHYNIHSTVETWRFFVLCCKLSHFV